MKNTQRNTLILRNTRYLQHQSLTASFWSSSQIQSGASYVLKKRLYYFFHLYQTLLMWLKCPNKRTTLQEKRHRCIEQTFGLWEGEGGFIWENSTETCILSCVKQITSPGWLHETSVQGWCTGKTQRDGMGSEVGGGIGMGNTCKSMADSRQCMAKPTTIL